jgi:hypothetical protein
VSVVAQNAGQRGGSIPPAIGFGPRLTGRVLTRRVLLLVALLGVAAGALGLKAVSRSNEKQLPPLPGVASITPHLVRGGQPSDFDFLQLRDGHNMRAIVNLRLDGETEADVAASFGLDCLSLPVVVGEPPTSADLIQLVPFVRRYSSGDAVVYVHDDDGGGRAITAGLMVLLLMGKSRDEAMSTLTAAEERQLSPNQSRALLALSKALTDPGADPANPYREAAVLRW